MKGDDNTIVIIAWNVIHSKWHWTEFVELWYIFTCIPKILIEWCIIQSLYFFFLFKAETKGGGQRGYVF